MKTPEYSDIPAERWLPIQGGYEDYYEISDHGRVKSYHKDPSGSLLTPSTNAKGYLRVRLYTPSSTPKTLFIHRLVALHFLPKPTDSRKTLVLHKNSVVTDCHYKNLEWGTHSENMDDMVDTGNHYVTQLTEDQVLSILDLRRKGHTLKELAASFNVSMGRLCKIMTGESWSSVTGIPRKKYGPRSRK